jgi:hypothetical protein
MLGGCEDELEIKILAFCEPTSSPTDTKLSLRGSDIFI